MAFATRSQRALFVWDQLDYPGGIALIHYCGFAKVSLPFLGHFG
jgi:hypothetical protein